MDDGWFLWFGGHLRSEFVFQKGAWQKKGGTKGDLSANLNAAAHSWWQSNQDALTISSMSEIYPTSVIWSFWGHDSFCILHRFWLPCNISKNLWTLAIQCSVLSLASFVISESFSVFVLSISGSVPTKMPLLPQVNNFTTTFLRRVSLRVLNCLQSITS